MKSCVCAYLGLASFIQCHICEIHAYFHVSSSCFCYSRCYRSSHCLHTSPFTFLSTCLTFHSFVCFLFVRFETKSHYMAQVSLNPHASASWVLALQTHTTMPRLFLSFFGRHLGSFYFSLCVANADLTICFWWLYVCLPHWYHPVGRITKS